jgi:hypothetical protein
MNIIGVPGSGRIKDPDSRVTDVHKAGCRDVGKLYQGVAYDDCTRLADCDTYADVRRQMPSYRDVKYYPCTKGLRRT